MLIEVILQALAKRSTVPSATFDAADLANALIWVSTNGTTTLAARILREAFNTPSGVLDSPVKLRIASVGKSCSFGGRPTCAAAHLMLPKHDELAQPC